MKPDSNEQIIHVALRHPHYDSRVFHKESVSSAAIYHTTLLACGHDKKEWYELDVKKVTFGDICIWKRIYSFGLYIFRSPASLLHVHETESLLLALLIKCFRPSKKIVFDVHEYFDLYVRQEKKKWYVRCYYWFFFYIIRPIVLPVVSHVCVVTPDMINQYTFGKKIPTVIFNYHKTDQLQEITGNNLLSKEKKYIVYHGGISKDRGALIFPELLRYLREDINLLIIGKWNNNDLKSSFFTKCREYQVEKRVVYPGSLSFLETMAYLANEVPMIGMTLFEYQADHEKAINIKMFEYLYFGIPQIGSDYRTYYQSYIVDNGLGRGVSLDAHPKDVAIEIEDMFERFDILQHHIQGSKETWSWRSEEKKLLDLYSDLF